MLLTNHDDTGVLTIAGSLDISAAEELRDALIHHLSQCAEPALELSAVEACDAAILQILCSAHRTAVRDGKSWRVINCPSAIVESAAALGLQLQEFGGETVRGL